MSRYFTIFTILIALVISVGCLIAQDDSDDLVLSGEEKRALDKFKAQVISNLPEDFMKTDFYLIRWLRVANLDISQAHNLLQKSLRWRKAENISNILSEDFSDMVHDYPMTIGTIRDKMGRPVSTCALGDWDLRGAVLQGRQKRLQRYLTYSLEEGQNQLFKAQQEALKRNIAVTQGLSLIDLEGGNVLQHLCPRCLAIIIQLLQESESYYPRFTKEVIMINAPRVTSVGLNSVKPFMSPETRRSLRIFDTNKEVWMKYLDEKIDRSQRTERYGGTKNNL